MSDQQQREAFEIEWAEMSDGIEELFDSKTREFIKSVAWTSFTAGVVYGCRGAYNHALAVAERVRRGIGAADVVV